MLTKFKYYKVAVKLNLKNGTAESFVIDFVTDKRPAELVLVLAKGRYGEEFANIAEIRRLE